MKKLYLKLKDSLIKLFKWVWSECKDWRTLILFGIICLIIGSPVWVCYLIGFIFHWNWAIVFASVAWAFWLLPGTPFIPLCISLTLILKRVYEKKKAHRSKKNNNDKSE